MPPQALAMMNSPFVRGLAEKFAKRVRADANVPMEQVVNRAYTIAISRKPTKNELATMLQFIDRQSASYGKTPEAKALAVADFCQLVFCLNEFLFVD